MKCLAIIGRQEDFEDQSKWFVNTSYLQALEAYHIAVFPIFSYTSLTWAVDNCDALLIPGGYDVHSFYLKEPLHRSCTYYPNGQDHFDFCCIAAFVKQKKPILGICRGLQLLQIYFGGSLQQDIDVSIHAQDHKHSLHLESDSVLHQLYPETSLVNSFHHQAVKQVPDVLQALAYSEDGYVEALCHRTLPILAVQWHPELRQEDPLLPYFLDVVCA